MNNQQIPASDKGRVSRNQRRLWTSHVRLLLGGRYLAVGRLLLPSSLQTALLLGRLSPKLGRIPSLCPECMHAAFMETFRSHLIRAIDGRSNQPYFGIVSCANALYICDISSLYLFRGKVRGGGSKREICFFTIWPCSSVV